MSKNIYVVRIERSNQLTVMVEADSEEEAENMVDNYAREGKLDGIVVDCKPAYDYAWCITKIDVIANNMEE